MAHTVLHVGPHKTGSTYLQRCFAALAGEFATRGVAVPTAWADSAANPSHRGLVELLTAGRTDAIAAMLHGLAAGGAHTVLISCEDIAGLPPPVLAPLAGLLAGGPVTIVYFVRRWSELVPSAWRELVRHGATTNLPEFAIDHIRTPFASDVLNFGLALDRLAGVFGRDALRIVSYSDLADRQAELFRFFCTQFLDGACAGRAPQIGRPNAALPPAEIEAVRLANLILGSTGAQATVDSTALLHRLRTDPAWPAHAARLERSVRTVRFWDDAYAPQALHASLVQNWGGAMWPARPRTRMFAPVRAELRYISADCLVDPAMLGVVDMLRSAVRAL